MPGISEMNKMKFPYSLMLLLLATATSMVITESKTIQNEVIGSQQPENAAQIGDRSPLRFVKENARHDPSVRAEMESDKSSKSRANTDFSSDVSTLAYADKKMADDASGNQDVAEMGQGDASFRGADGGTFNENPNDSVSMDTVSVPDHYEGRQRRQRIPCHNCSCYLTSPDMVSAKCENLHFWSVPQNLPSNTGSLNMAENRLRSFSVKSFRKYTSLYNVTLFKNSYMTKILNCSDCHNSTHMTNLDLSSCNIGSIDDRSFQQLPNLLNLSLENNNITQLTSQMFVGLKNLRHLNLANNNLKFIENGTFDSLVSLRSLDLSLNGGLGYSPKRLRPALLANLKQLRTLDIHGSSIGDLEYPNEALQQLTNLKHLVIDGLSKETEFGPEMRSLKHLTHLEIGGHNGKCNILQINGSFFNNTPYLQSFGISYCRLQNITPDAFKNIPDLHSLTISYMVNYELPHVLDDLVGLRNSSLKSLSLTRVYHTSYPCRFLTGTHAKNLRYMNLESLDLSGNLLALLGDDFLAGLPKSLKKLFLRGNKFSLKGNLLGALSKFVNLEVLDMSVQNEDDYSVKDDFGFQDKKTTLEHRDSDLYHGSMVNINVQDNVIPGLKCPSCDRTYPGDNNEGIQSYDVPDAVNTSGYLYDSSMNQNFGRPNFDEGANGIVGKMLKIPPKLKILKASKYNLLGHVLFIHSLPKHISLTEIDFSDNYLTNFYKKMPLHVRRANLNNNYCTGISRGFFKPNNSLNHLTMSNNYLGPVFATDFDGQYFSQLKKAAFLDISRNLISQLPPKFFRGLSNLQALDLSDNKLQVFNVSLSSMKKLQYLDLSKNSISWITKEVRGQLDDLANLSICAISVDLTSNPLPCTCDGIELLNWMATTNVCLANEERLECRWGNDGTELIGNLKDRVKFLRHRCVSKSTFVIVCSVSVSSFVILFGIGTMYRYRWKLRYLRNIAMAKMFGFKQNAADDARRAFDAYILYTDETLRFVRNQCIPELEQKRGHRLCLADRDFLPGAIMVSNIIGAVQNSSKVVPIVTPNFYKGLYSEYAVKMTVNEEIYKDRQILHLFVYKPTENMTRDFLMAMKRNSFTEYPPEEENNEEMNKQMWDELSHAIGHAAKREEQ